MQRPLSLPWGLGVAFLATAVATVLRHWLVPVIGMDYPFILYFAAVAVVAWYGGWSAGVVAIALSSAASTRFLEAPSGGEPLQPSEVAALAVFVMVNAAIVLVMQRLHAARAALHIQNTQLTDEMTRRRVAEHVAFDEHERFRQTLTSIGDAVIVTDADGRITLLNTVAESLTGWSAADASGRQMEEIFRIVHQSTRVTVRNPARRAMEEGVIVGLANHTLLIRRDGTEIPIDDSAAPIRNADGSVVGCVLVFRDITERYAAEAAMRSSEAELADLVEHANVGILQAAPDGRIISANDEQLRLLGHTYAEVVGRNMAEFYHDDSVTPHILNALHADRPVRDVRSRLQCRDGSIKHVLINATGRWKDGVLQRVHCFTLDVSERARVEQQESDLRESEARFRMIADNIAALAWTSDGKGLPTWYNQRWFDYTGMTLEEINNGGWERLHHPAHLDRVRSTFEESRARGTPWEATYPLRGADGAYRWFLSRCLPISDHTGAIVRWFGTNVDITEQVEMESALREADRRKDEFVATLAHELRNPLAPLQHALYVLDDPNIGPARVRALVALMQRQVGQMSRLVDDLIDLSRLRRRTPELRRAPIAVATIVEQAIEAARPLIDRAQHTLTVHVPAHPIVVNADGVRVTQALVNLLRNAVKFTDAGGTIDIRVNRAGDHVRFEVADSGIGIAAERLPMVFDMFTQGHQLLESSRGGLGIGLTLARMMIELHGGTVTAYSDGAGRGSSFVILLPVASVATVEDHSVDVPASAPLEPTNGQRETRNTAPAILVRDTARRAAERDTTLVGARRIVVADDNEESAETLALLLRLRGFDVATAYDGDAVVDAVAEYQPDLVFLDIGMPGRSGYDACRAIRALPNGSSMLIVALTGWGQANDRERSREAGFDVHLVKPVDDDTLMSLLRGDVREAS